MDSPTRARAGITAGRPDQRIGWIDVGRGVSIILVVYFHVILRCNTQDIPVAKLYRMLDYLAGPIRMPFRFW